MVSHKHSFWWSGLLTFLVLAGITFAGKAQPEDGIRTQDLKQWSGADRAALVQLDDGVLTIRAEDESTILISPKSYTNFRCRFEIKADSLPASYFQFRTSNSADLEDGYRVSLNHHLDTQWPLGSIEDDARANWIEEVKGGEWAEVLIVAVGDLLQVMLDGRKVAEVHDYDDSEGFLAFRVAPRSTIMLRNFALKSLEATSGSSISLETLMREEEAAKVIQLFDGISLDGWTPVGEATWIIQDGVLHAYSGKKGGFLVSDFSGKNFHLTLSFKIANGHNSGIFIRKPQVDSLPTMQNSLECNIYDHNGFSHLYSTGSIATHARAPLGLVDYDGWNRMEIFAYEDHICLYVNDRKASEAHLPSFNHIGQICLQGGIQIFAEGQPPSNIEFKDIVVRDFSGIVLPLDH